MKALSRIYIAICFAILYAPIAIIILFSFNSESSTAVFGGFSLRWYAELFTNNPDIFVALRNTLLLAVSSAAISTVIATGAAVGISRMRSTKARSAILSVTNIPMMNPDIVTGISMMLLFVFFGSIISSSSEKLNFVTVLIAHVTFNLPYVYLCVAPRLRQMDKHLPEAAQDLGCTPVQSFFKVELPFLTPGIVSGLIMAFTLSLDDFVISYFTTSETTFLTLPLYIFSLTKKQVKPTLYALSTIIIVTIMILLVLSNLSKSKDTGKKVK